MFNRLVNDLNSMCVHAYRYRANVYMQATVLGMNVCVLTTVHRVNVFVQVTGYRVDVCVDIGHEVNLCMRAD